MTGGIGDGYRLGRRTALDGLRGYSVLLVVVGHTLAPENSVGTVGVTLFFTLSGFLISRLLIEERALTGRIDYRAFVVRRARRLVPALALFLCAALCICLRNGFPLTWVVLPAVYATNLAMTAGEPVQLTGHTWSLGLEEQFYLLWPPLLALTLRRGRSPVIPLALLTVVVTLWRTFGASSGWSYLRLAYGPDMRMDAILVGCLLACVAGQLRRIPPSAALGAGCGLLALGCTVRLETEPALMPLATTCSAVVVAVAASRAPGVLPLRPLCLLGTISYGVYLWHKPIAMAQHGIVMIPLVLAISVAVATLSWRCVESRFILRPRI